jgi:peptidoglycan LD-endopeptidase CwlK
MAFCLSKLSRDRLQSVPSDLVRVVERAIQITTQDFRVQEGLLTRESQPSWLRAAPDHALAASHRPRRRYWSRWMAARSAGNGKTTMQAAARELGVPVRWDGCWGSLFTIETPADSFADYVAACRATGQKPFLDRPHFELSRVCRHDGPDQGP